MRKHLWLLAGAVAMLAPSVASAQFTGDQELGKHWTLRAGAFVAEKKASREKGGDVWFTLGAERPFYETEQWAGTLSIDYYGAEGIYSVPICLNARGATNGVRYGAGVGLSLGHDVEKGISALAYNLLVGYDLTTGPNTISVDLRYLGTNASRQELNGWALTVGYKF